MSSWTKAGAFSTGKGKAPRLEELIDLVKLKPKKFTTLRPIGPVHFYAEYWIEIKTNAGNVTKIRKISPTFNPKTMEFDKPCPYMDILGQTPRIIALMNAINRDEQRNEPRRRSKPTKAERTPVKIDGQTVYLKQKDSESWSPVGAYRITSSAGGKIQDLAAINKHLNKKTGEKQPYGPEHPRYGFDIVIKHDPDRAPAEQYSVQKDKATKLTEEEQQYLVQNIWVEKPEKYEDALKEAKRLKEKLVDAEGGDDEESPKKSKKKASKPDYLSGLDDDDDEDEAPRKKKKKTSSSSSSSTGVKKKKKSKIRL